MTENALQRDEAWEIFPWPCIGEFWFLAFGLSMHPAYPAIVARLRASAKLLDVGTCVGQDLRRLLVDGAPLASLYGTDIFAAYERVGHALFNDAATFTGRFIAGDLFDDAPDSALAQTRGTWDIVSATMFLHVFDRADQQRACVRLLGLLAAAPGSMLVGAQTATVRPGEHVLRPPFVKEGEHKTIFRHSRETFRQMWDEVARETGAALKVWAEYEPRQPEQTAGQQEGNFFTGDDQRRLFFTVERV